jgi:RNA polymerase sigma-70 factor (ECF subfamily)
MIDPMAADGGNVTALLSRWAAGDEKALEKLTPLVYRELHAIARRQLGRERQNHTLQPTALVNELYLRVAAQDKFSVQNRAHFFAIAATMMRRILVDLARRRLAAKRTADEPETSDGRAEAAVESSEEFLDLHNALDRLARQDERKARAIELRYFGGLERDEIAAVLGVSLGTVKRDLALAEAWLRRELAGDGG